MLPVFVLTLLAATVVADTPQGRADLVTWIPSGPSAGWATPIAHEIRPEGVARTPLLAPNWFAKLPGTRLDLATEGSLDLGAFPGKVVLLDFWASWCGPCQKELPHLQRLHAEREKDGLVAIAVNVNEERELAVSKAKELGLTMPIAISAGLDDRLAVHTLPTVVLADRRGRIRARWDGYRTGYEHSIGEAVSRLLADDPEGALRPVAEVLKGNGLLRGVWVRDMPGEVDGVVALLEKDPDAMRIVASGGGSILSFDRDGDIRGKVPAPPWAGRLLEFGRDPGGNREVAAFRPGGTTLGIVSLPSGRSRPIAAGAPIASVAASLGGASDTRSLAIVTTNGTALAQAFDAEARLQGGVPKILDVTRAPHRGVLALYEDGSIAEISTATHKREAKAKGAARLLAADEAWAAVGPRGVVASAVGRFLPGERRQLAVVTYAGHVALLDTGNGALLVDLVWPDAREVAAVDLDGDGLDELLVGAARSITALRASTSTGR